VLFLLELGPALALGLLLGWRWPQLPARLAPPLVNWGVPFSLTGLLLRAGVDWRYGQVALLALVVVTLALLLVRGWFRAPHEQLAAVVGNTAYFGIPAALALLPPQAVGFAISYDLAATLFTWCLGPLLLAGERLRLQPLLRALAASPASRGLVAATLLQFTPWRALLANWLWWPARVVVLLSLLLVGMRLAQRTAIQLPRRLWAVLAVKLLLFPLVLLGLCLLLGRTPLALPPLATAAVVLQAAAPTAVAVLLLAEATPQRQTATVQAAAGLVLVSTLLALLTVPLWARVLAALGLHGVSAAASGG
jgi:predicted permease